jgi:hypothetical protein
MLTVALFVLVVARFLTGCVCTFVCCWVANSGVAVEVDRKYLHPGKSATQYHCELISELTVTNALYSERAAPEPCSAQLLSNTVGSVLVLRMAKSVKSKGKISIEHKTRATVFTTKSSWRVSWVNRNTFPMIGDFLRLLNLVWCGEQYRLENSYN